MAQRGRPDPFGFFDEIVCINLDQRPDRWLRALREFERLGIAGHVTRAPAVVPADGNAALGCKLSHLRVLASARARGLTNVLIFEDDVTFAWRATRALEKAAADLESLDWQMLYLGIDLIEPPSRVTPNLLRSHGGYLGHAYAVHRSAFDSILTPLSLDETQWYRGYEDAIDRFYSEQIHPRHMCLCVDPMICWQHPGFSDLEHRRVDYTDARSRFARYARSARRGVQRASG